MKKEISQQIFFGVNELLATGINEEETVIYLSLSVLSHQNDITDIVLMIDQKTFNDMSKSINKTIKELKNEKNIL